MKNKKIIITLSIIAILVLTIGITYSIFTSSKTSKNSNLVVGDIYMHYNETNQIQMENATPTNPYVVNPIMATQEYTEGGTNELSKCVDAFVNIEFSTEESLSLCKGNSVEGITLQQAYDQGFLDRMNLTNAFIQENILTINSSIPYFEFTIDGKNTHTKNKILYNIQLVHGDGETNRIRILDKFLKFRLVEVNNNQEKILKDRLTIDSIDNTTIYSSAIQANTTGEVVYTYKLYMWIDENVNICGGTQTEGCDYNLSDWSNLFASVKVNVNGKYVEGTNFVEAVKNRYNENNQDGLVAVNTDGDLATTSDTIREYRYSGTSANITNNYVSFNNELWRIVGLFTETTVDRKKEQLIKIVRNEGLTNLPTSFKASNTYQGTTTETTYYTFGSSDGTTAYWNNPDSTYSESAYSGNLNDWTRSGVMHYLNDTYLPAIETKYANMIENVVYHLGNSDDSYTPAKSYEEERGTSICARGVYSNNDDTCQVFYNNQATWTGKVGLLYASDQAYTRSSGSWTSTLNTDISSWFSPSNYNWLISPSAYNDTSVMGVTTGGTVGGYRYTYGSLFEIRPCLYLKSDTEIILGSGTIDDPYILNVL